ncbi:PREDICTED: uncharacterized protein LOC18613772 isoform X2 [Theobroma cacao]|uniref:Uncharacterized protein LOC18613772 isoform X2 n=1 Tax=Theobroma cacao TaxID=3641 RepID=A0AB32X0X4_THECC|nr:PREDICTED: uncharacterized protein LOC18613772 isoform X2 [Theobroma cacao]
MSSAAISFISSPNSPRLSHVSPTNRNAILLTATPSCRISSLKPPSLSSIFIRIPYGSFKKSSFFTSSRTFSPVMEWQDCTVKTEIDVPASMAYKCYSDREAIPNWMPFISSVKPIPNQKIHWRSLEGLPNRGVVRFYPKGPSSCVVELTVSYEVPQLLAPVASALQPFLENLLKRGLDRFENFAKSSGSTR